MAAGRVHEAADAYRQAVARNGEYAEAHFNLANACQELHDMDEARRCFSKAAELRPEKRLWRLRADICGPVVFESVQEIEEHCARVEGCCMSGATCPHPLPLPRRRLLKKCMLA
jgi:tetratricopeptide (TPR) repeat protein